MPDYVALKEICLDMHQGINTVADKVEYLDEGKPIIQSKNITSNYLDLEDVRYLSETDYNKYKDKYNPKKGDILFCNIGTIGSSLVINEEVDFLIAWNLFKIKLNKSICNERYVKYYLDYLKVLKYYDRLLTGGTVKFINKTKLGETLIPLPNLNQQIKIAKTLDQAQELIDKRKAQIEALDELIQSVFYEMFGDPVQNPFSFDQYKIKDLVIDDKYAIKAGPFGSALKKEYYVESGYKVYGQEQVIQGDLAYGDYYIDEDRYRMLENCKIQSGDLLISLVGTFGKMLVVPDNFQEGIINPRLMKISFDQSKILPQFFKSMFQNEAMIKYMNRNTHGATMGILNTTIIKELNVIVPSLEMQLDYLNRRMFIEKQKELLNESLVELENNFNSLMQRAFNGESLC